VATSQCLLGAVAASYPIGNVSISILPRDERGNPINEDPKVNLARIPRSLSRHISGSAATHANKVSVTQIPVLKSKTGRGFSNFALNLHFGFQFE